MGRFQKVFRLLTARNISTVLAMIIKDFTVLILVLLIGYALVAVIR